MADMDGDQVLESALQLESRERMRVANALLESLVKDDCVRDVLQTEWAAVSDEPLVDVRGNRAELIDLEEVRRRRQAWR